MNIGMRQCYVALSLVLMTLGLVYLMTPSVSIVTFNAHEVQGKLIRQLAEHAASDDQVQKMNMAFKQHLNQVLSEYARSHHVVIMESRSVLAGAKDVTSELLRQLRGKHA